MDVKLTRKISRLQISHNRLTVSGIEIESAGIIPSLVCKNVSTKNIFAHRIVYTHSQYNSLKELCLQTVSGQTLYYSSKDVKMAQL